MKLQQTAKHRAYAHKQLGQAVEGVLSGLAAVEARLAGKAWVSGLLAANPPLGAQAERLREVLDRDRALVSAGPPRHEQAERAPVAAPSVLTSGFAREQDPVAKASSPVPVCDEPIRTRTMARLLAGQGHQARALSIYDHLLARADADESLRAEAELLRSQTG